MEAVGVISKTLVSIVVGRKSVVSFFEPPWTWTPQEEREKVVFSDTVRMVH